MDRHIDLNCDLGEGSGRDELILPWITSANIACGYHAGDPGEMARTVRAALPLGVRLGAHPSWPDRSGFGRRNMSMEPDAACELVLYQVGALEAIVRAAGGCLRHVKPHGALYNQAARDRPLAEAIAGAVRAFDPALVLVGLSGGELLRAGLAAGLVCAGEVFADRGYRPDGSLVPRGQPGALIEDEAAVIAQALGLAGSGRVVAVDGTTLELQADTICLHGDQPDAATFARRLRTALEAAGIAVEAELIK